MELIKESFTLNLYIMKLFGLYPPDNYKLLYKIHSIFLYVIFILPIPCLGCFYLLVDDSISLAVVADNAFLLAEMGCYIIKFLPFITNSKQIKTCINYIEKTQSCITTANEKKINDVCIKTCRRITKIFLMSVTAGVTSWSVKPLLLKTAKLPMDLWLPYKTTETFNFLVTYMYLVVAVAYAAFCSGVTNPLIAGLACLASGQLNIVKDSFQNQTKINARFIKSVIKHHYKILKFVREYQRCFSLVVFSQFAGSVLVICVSCLQIIMVSNKSIYTINNMFF